MDTAATRYLLQRNALFRDLPDATLDKIVALTKRRRYKKGQTIFMQGDPGDALYGVVSGAVRVSSSAASSAEVFLNIMEPGDSFGEIALLDGEARTATAVATEATDLVVIEREQFLRLLMDEHQLTMHLLKLCCQRVRWTSELIEDSAFLTSPERLAKKLLSLGRLHGEETPAGTKMKITQADLANFLNVSRQFVNQYLQEWRQSGWLDVGRGSVTLIDTESLHNFIDGDCSNDAG